MFFSVALGKDVAVNTILGWPTILSLEMDLRNSSHCIFSHELNYTFPITDAEPRVGSHGSALIDSSDFQHFRKHPTRHSCQLDNTLIATPVPESPLHCTVIDDTSDGFLVRTVTATIASHTLIMPL